MLRYIPKYPMSLTSGEREIDVLGVFSFSINIPRAEAIYLLWINTSDAKYFISLPMGIKDAIILDSREIDKEVEIHFGANAPIEGIAKRISYQRKEHGYLISTICILDPKVLDKLGYDKDAGEIDVDISRFDLMEFD